MKALAVSQEGGGDKVGVVREHSGKTQGRAKVKPLRQECVLGMIRQSVWLERVRRERESKGQSGGDFVFNLCY